MNSGRGFFQVVCRLLLVAAFSLVQLGSVSLASAADADLDTTYHVDGWSVADMSVFSDTAYGVAVQADGRIVVVGSSPNGRNLDFSVTRRATNGNIDMTMGGDGRDVRHFSFGRDEARDVVVQADGRIVVAGWLTRDGSLQEIALLRYTINGNLDPDFNSNGYVSAGYGGTDTFGRAVDLQPDGKIVVAGYATSSLTNLFVTARFLGDENQIFADGLEYGSTEPWSTTVP